MGQEQGGDRVKKRAYWFMRRGTCSLSYQSESVRATSQLAGSVQRPTPSSGFNLPWNSASSEHEVLSALDHLGCPRPDYPACSPSTVASDPGSDRTQRYPGAAESAVHSIGDMLLCGLVVWAKEGIRREGGRDWDDRAGNSAGRGGDLARSRLRNGAPLPGPADETARWSLRREE